MGISIYEIIVILIIGIIFLKPKHLSESSYKIGILYKSLLKKIIKIKKDINL